MGLFKISPSSMDGMQEGQWQDIYSIPDGPRPTTAAFAAVPASINAGSTAGVWR